MESDNPLTAPHPAASALLTIDMQADFAYPDGASPVAGTPAILPHLAELTRTYRQAGLPILHIVRLYLADGSNAEPVRRPALASGRSIVVPDTPGSQIVPEILAEPAELEPDTLLNGEPQWLGAREAILYKPRWGAFFRTPLERILAGLGVDTVVVAGCNFPNCPRTTIYEASERDFRTVAVADAISGVYPRGAEEIRAIGAFTPEAATWREQVTGERA